MRQTVKFVILTIYKAIIKLRIIIKKCLEKEFKSIEKSNTLL